VTAACASAPPPPPADPVAPAVDSAPAASGSSASAAAPACPSDLATLFGKPCGPDGAVCGSENPTGFSNIAACQAGVWVHVEGPPPPAGAGGTGGTKAPAKKVGKVGDVCGAVAGWRDPAPPGGYATCGAGLSCCGHCGGAQGGPLFCETKCADCSVSPNDKIPAAPH
jgi:hypothetical protein